ncbi:MAG: arylsulfatase A-like enzyme [Hyphomicrobiaceae bacterium]|jgi:arylsulfatase A-like enzyme
MNRLIGVLVGVVVLVLSGTASVSIAASGPHGELRGVVLIVIDTLRADHLGTYGSMRGLSSRIDRMAGDGLIFARATAASSWTRSSLATVHLGVSPEVHGVHDREHSLPPTMPTLAGTLSAAGVETVGLHANVNTGASFGFSRGFDHYAHATATRKYPEDSDPLVSAETMTREVLEEIDEREMGSQRPFFFSVHYVDPHDPYFDHPELGRGAQPAGRFNGSRKALQRMDSLPAAKRTPLDEERIRFLYEGEVQWVDRHVGGLLDGLAERGLLKDCLVILTSDHGEGLWEHGERAHGRDLYEEQIHVPLIVTTPVGWEIAPQHITGRVAHEDIPATIASAFGVSLPPAWTGRDLVKMVRDGSPGRSEVRSSLSLDWLDIAALIEGDRKAIRNRSFDPERRDRTHVVREGDTLMGLSWKYFGSSDAIGRFTALNQSLLGGRGTHGPLPRGQRLKVPDVEGDSGLLLEVYDLASDPRETRNRATDNPKFAARMHKELAAGAKPKAEPAPSKPIGAMDPDVLDRLRGLGYLE